MNNTTTTPTISHNNKQTQNGYKNTAIGVLPSNWEVRKLGELCFGKGEYGINAAAVNFSENLPAYIRITDIDDDGYFSSNKKCSVDDINSSNFYLNKNDIVFVRTGADTGKTYLYNENDGKLVFAGFLIRFKIDTSKANDYFLRSFTQSKPYWDWVKTVCTRSGQPGINSAEYYSLQLPIPPLPEQQKIAEILSTWDEAITNCKNTINTLKARNKGLAQQLFSGKKRLKGFSDKWVETTIEKITKYFSNKNKSLIDARIYSVTNSNGFVYQSDHFSREVAGDDLTGYKIVRKNEFAYNPARINVGSIAFFTDDIGVISSLYVCFKTNEKVTNKFLIEWLKIDKTKHDIERYGEGGVRIYLWYDLFKKLKINLPSLEEQTAIAEVLETTDQELKSYQAKLEALQNQKKGLMQQLLTGKIRVNVK